MRPARKSSNDLLSAGLERLYTGDWQLNMELFGVKCGVALERGSVAITFKKIPQAYHNNAVNL